MQEHRNVDGSTSYNFNRPAVSNGTIHIDRFGVSKVETIEIEVRLNPSWRASHRGLTLVVQVCKSKQVTVDRIEIV